MRCLLNIGVINEYVYKLLKEVNNNFNCFDIF